MPAEMPADPKALADEIERMTSHRIHIGSRSCLASVEDARSLGLFVDDNRAAILAALRATDASAAEAAMRERCAQVCASWDDPPAGVKAAIRPEHLDTARATARGIALAIRDLPLSTDTGERDA